MARMTGRPLTSDRDDSEWGFERGAWEGLAAPGIEKRETGRVAAQAPSVSRFSFPVSRPSSQYPIPEGAEKHDDADDAVGREERCIEAR